jgi:ROS/MUCR transcriptional regulator protein
MHGLDGRSYRAKYGIPRKQPLAAKVTTARRRELVQGTRPWEQAPTFHKAQVHDGHAMPAPAAEALPDESEAPTAAVPAPPKRQRKTPAKKSSRKRSAQG